MKEKIMAKTFGELLSKKKSSYLALIACFGIAVLLATDAAAAGELRIGTSKVRITPPNGTPMAGYYSERKSEGVLDDLYAKAVVLDDGKNRAAMVVCDVIGLPQSTVAAARKIIAEKTGIPPDAVMISATHTHTGPVVRGDSKMDDLVASGKETPQSYARQLPKWIAQAVEEAAGQAAVVRVSYGSQDEPGVSFIRRFWMKDGTVGWNPGKRNPKIARPIGVIDPAVQVFYAETAEKKNAQPVLTYVNFANHLDTTGGKLISADFPATLARCLADCRGPEMLTVFANGTCGNINHIDVTSAAPQHGPLEAKRIGTALAGDVAKAYLHLTPVENTTLRVRRETVSLDSAPFTPDELRESKELVAKKGARRPFLQQVKAYRIVDVAQRQGKPIDVDVQVFSLGEDVAWVALPGEVFVELGLSIKAASPFRQTNVVELANGFTSYIPHRSAYAEGQYEAVSSRCAEGSGERLVATAVRLLDDLHQEAAKAVK